MAYEMVEAEKCGQCGTPAYWAFSDNNEITFELEEVTCYACAFKATEEKNKTRNEGTQYMVKAVAEEGSVLPGREDFVQRQMKKAARKAAKHNH